MFYIVHDVAYCCEIHDLLTDYDKFGATIEAWVTNGPGGGNPCILVSFPTVEKAQRYALYLWAYDGEDFAFSHIETDVDPVVWKKDMLHFIKNHL